MPSRVKPYDVLVVGGGVAGLTAAAFASKGGASVLLLEASPEFGGRARTRNVSGYHFNQGAHALYCGGFLDAALHDLDVAVSGGMPQLATGFFVSDNTLHQAPFSAAGLAGTTLLSEAEKGELVLIFRRLRDPSMEAPSGTSLQDALAALSLSPTVRAALAAMTRLTSLVHAPKAADGRALLKQLRGGLTRSVLYLDGGWGAMFGGLRSACVRLGADLRSSGRVELVEPGPPWRAMLADGSAVSAHAVILAVEPAPATAIFPAIGTDAADATPARAACLDIGLASLPRPDHLFALGVDRPLYLSVHSAAARLAPEGAALVHLVRYLEPGEAPKRGPLVAELEAFMDLLQPGWRDHERARQFLPAMPAVSAIPLAAKGGVDGRPPTEVPNAEGLFIAGDWVGPAGMLADAAAASGRSAGEAAAAFARG